MKIYQSRNRSLAIMDTAPNLASLSATIARFLDSSEVELRVNAEPLEDPAPYERMLLGMSIHKTLGPILIAVEEDGFVHIAGESDWLRKFAKTFEFDDDAISGMHRHPEFFIQQGFAAGSLSTIVEIS